MYIFYYHYSKHLVSISYSTLMSVPIKNGKIPSIHPSPDQTSNPKLDLAKLDLDPLTQPKPQRNSNPGLRFFYLKVKTDRPNPKCLNPGQVRSICWSKM